VNRLRVRGIRHEEFSVHLHHLKDAKCVADALGQGDASVIPSKTGWTVSVFPSSRQLAEILNALQTCLAEDDIRLVRVTIDGNTYAMESAPTD
jgi:hypothetical protein